MRDDNRLVTPDIRDAERLQGFEADWTQLSEEGFSLRQGGRWKLVGNAVSVPVAAWLSRRLVKPMSFDYSLSPAQWGRSVWPNAAWGGLGKVYPVKISEWPANESPTNLSEFLRYPVRLLSEKATAGFLQRARAGTLNFAPGFLKGVEVHLRRMRRRKYTQAA
jgi:DNA (cytosine-5)-methyltransferase 1